MQSLPLAGSLLGTVKLGQQLGCLGHPGRLRGVQRQIAPVHPAEHQVIIDVHRCLGLGGRVSSQRQQALDGAVERGDALLVSALDRNTPAVCECSAHARLLAQNLANAAPAGRRRPDGAVGGLIGAAAPGLVRRTCCWLAASSGDLPAARPPEDHDWLTYSGTCPSSSSKAPANVPAMTTVTMAMTMSELP